MSPTTLFTQAQRNLIRSIAEECARQPEEAEAGLAGSEELAVWETLGYTRFEDWDAEQLMTVQKCAQECARRQSGAMSVYEMCVAADEAKSH